MADDEHVERLKREEAVEWNRWRKSLRENSPDVQPDLSGAELAGLNLSERDLRDANLTDADIRRANLWGTDLTAAELQGANLLDANLPRTNLQYANLAGADLRGANLTEARIRHTTNLNDATYDDRTLWPEEFEPESTGAVRASADEAQPASLRDIAETFMAYVGIPALLLYPLGLFMLALQLFRNYDLKFLTAWYASSLVSNVVVAGHGAKSFLLPLIIALVVSLLVAKVTFLFLRKKWRRFSSGNFWINLWRLAKAAPEVVWSITALFALVIIAFVLLFIFSDLYEYGNLFAVPFAIAVSFVGGFVIYINHQNSDYEVMKLSRGVAEGWILWGLAIAYFGGLVGAVTTVFTESEVLPRVSMNIEQDTSEESSASEQFPIQVKDGLLLSQSGGYWYVLCLEEADSTTCSYVSSDTSSTQDERPRRTGGGPAGTITEKTTEATEEEVTVTATGESIEATAKQSTETTIEEGTEPTEEETAEESTQPPASLVTPVLERRTEADILAIPDDAAKNVTVTR